MSCQSFVIIIFGRPRSLSKPSTYSEESLYSFCAASELMFWAISRLRCISPMRHLASSSSFFLSPNFYEMVTERVSISFLFFRPWSHHRPVCRVRLLSSNSPCRFSFTTAPTASNSAETSIHIPFGFVWPHASWVLCPPLLPVRVPVPISALPLYTFLCHGFHQHHRCLYNTRQSFSFVG